MLLPHNKKLYENIIRELDSSVHSILYVQGTGVGKSYVYFELVNTRFANKKVLYVVPKHAVRENLNLYNEELTANVTYITYNEFNKNITNKYRDYNVVFFDEAHHMASNKRAKNIIKLRDAILENNGYIFGMTATPIRSSDNINVSTIFEKTVYGYSIFQCIEQKLMPSVEYYVGAKIKSARRADFTESRTELQKAISLYHKNKWLVFFDSIKQLEKHKDFIQSLYPDHELIVVHSKCRNIKYLLHQISITKKCVVLTVNQLLEGIHIEGIEAVLLLRNVHSLLVFQQMIGRIMKIGSKSSPIFLDCTGSAMSLLTKLMTYNYGKAYDVEAMSVDTLNVNALNELAVMRRYPKRKKTVKVRLSNLRKYDITNVIEKLSTKYFQFEGTWYESIQHCCKELEISYNSVNNRIKKGLTPVEAINKVIDLTRFTYNGVTYQNMDKCLSQLDISKNDYLQAKTSKYTPEQVITRLLKRKKSIYVKNGNVYGSVYDYLYKTNKDVNTYLLGYEGGKF